MAKKTKKFQLKLPSQTDHLELIREFVSGIAKNVGFGAEEISKIELAVDEACTNVVRHAYHNDTSHAIDIQVKTDLEKLTVIISDKGKGFDPKKVKIPDMKEYMSEMRVGGLGIYLMQTLMDEVDFQIEPGKRNQVRMVKYLPD